MFRREPEIVTIKSENDLDKMARAGRFFCAYPDASKSQHVDILFQPRVVTKAPCPMGFMLLLSTRTFGESSWADSILFFFALFLSSPQQV